MHSKSNNIEIMMNDEACKVKKELLIHLNIYFKKKLELVKGSEFSFDYVQLLYYKCRKINPDCGGS